ncbi:MAG TPA: hypothetical protein EYQ83_09995 [Acidobacteria bacterium]|nr:hypothetical protein [Acidobacteriota bacterium]
MWPTPLVTDTANSIPAAVLAVVVMSTEAVSVWSCRSVARAAASSSCGGTVTPRSARYRLSIRSMKKLPPRNVWRPSRSLGSPTTDVMGVGSVTAGM